MLLHVINQFKLLNLLFIQQLEM